ncbi:diguanylate cyclase [Devosia sp. 1566]|uniref:GGDEF domain-containing protein n=1 Tax=Devosia sp. 1566 TaxID=2499144 RepID=UPI000FD81A9D|nr:diguanylate cyclase [Devosia sp. 1566]
MTDLLSGGDTGFYWDRVRVALESLTRAWSQASAKQGSKLVTLSRPAVDQQAEAALHWAWRSAQRAGGPVSLLLLAIDRKDDFLAAYGPAAAENCALLVGEAISSALPHGEIGFLRFGPNEFLVLLPGVERRAARKLARHLVDAVRACRLSHKESHAGVVTTSVGLVSAAPEHWPASEVLRRAANGLHKAQRGGLARIAVAELRALSRRAA